MITQWFIKKEKITKADALSRIEINVTENDDVSLIVNPDNLTSECDLSNDLINEKDDNETIHSSHENPIFNKLISEKPLNSFKNQIIFHVFKSNVATVVNKSKIFNHNRIIS